MNPIPTSFAKGNHEDPGHVRHLPDLFFSLLSPAGHIRCIHLPHLPLLNSALAIVIEDYLDRYVGT